MHEVKSSKIVFFSTALLGLLLMASTATAADIRAGSKNNQNVTVGTNESVRNLYAVGGNVLVSANSQKDATVAGGMVTVNGNTADDLTVAGGNLFLNGSIGGSLKAVGGNITLSSKVNEDAVIAGGNVNITPTAQIGSDLIVAAGTLTIDAPVNGNIQFAGGNLIINSKVVGNIDARVGKITFGSGANVLGTVNYTSRTAAQVDNGAHIQQLNFKAVKTNASSAFGAFLVTLLFKMVALIIAAYILFALFHTNYENFVRRTQEHFWLSVLWGLLILIITPIVAVILMITLIGFYIGLILLLAYVLTLILGALIGFASFGVWLVSKIRRRSDVLGYGTIAAGMVAIGIINLIPVIGIIISFIIFLCGLGSFIYTFKAARV